MIAMEENIDKIFPKGHKIIRHAINKQIKNVSPEILITLILKLYHKHAKLIAAYFIKSNLY